MADYVSGTCDVCGLGFDELAALEVHEDSCVLVPPSLDCLGCGRRYFDVSLADEHERECGDYLEAARAVVDAARAVAWSVEVTHEEDGEPVGLYAINKSAVALLLRAVNGGE